METESDAVAHAFGVALHRLREVRGLSLRALGDQVHYSYSQLSRAERGEHLPSPELVKKVDDELRAGGLLTALRTLGPAPVPPGPKRRGPSAPRLHLDVGATVTLHMQTPTGEAVQVALSRRHFNELLSAGVLRLMLPAGVTDPEQADRAARILSGDHAVDATMIGYFHRMLDEDFTTDKKSGPRKLIGHTLAQISLLRQLRTGTAPGGGDGLNHLLTRYAEFAGWLHQDLGDTTAATYWTGEAMRWAQFGDDPTMQAYLLVRSSNIALLDRNARDVIESAAAARRVAGPIHPRLHALAAQQEARGWALAGDAGRFQTGLDEARATC